MSNEDGALFCEQCKSDLSAVPAAAAMPMAEVIEPMAAEASPFAAMMEPTPGIPAAAIIEPPAAQIIDAPAVVPVAIPEPAPLPAMAPPIEAADVAAAVAAPPPAAPPAAPAAKPAAGPTPGRSSVPVGSKPKLVVKRGQKVGYEFPIYADDNYVGRADEKPVDIDLEDQEPPDRVWCSRQHALIHYDENAGNITLEDLNSANGTYVNRERVYPGQPRQLFVNDTIQIGTVHLSLKV
jgi:hypothetical protein